MANQKGLAVQHTIRTLYERGRSIRGISRDLGISRNTVRGYLPEREQTDPLPTGSVAESDPGAIIGSDAQTDPPIIGSSKCEEHREWIEEALLRGLHGVRIHQDLVAEHGFTGSYSSVRRFIQSLQARTPTPFRRLETDPGEEAQVDFGQGAFVVDANGKRRRPHLFRVVLSHSRKAYAEVVWRQSTENFIRALENAFRHFGGVPKKIIPDNLKAVVTRADWYDPEIHPKITAFCEHYGTVMLPTKPYTPRHKGKVERAVDYVQENALKGRTFSSLTEQNEYLWQWEEKVADTRLHGTTRRQVRQAFELEKEHLQALPSTLFPCFQEAYRKGSLDGHVEVDRAYYSVPPEFTGRQVLVRWDGRVVKIFRPDTMNQVRVHAHVDPGRFSTNEADVPRKRISSIEQGRHFLLKKLALVGDDVHEWGSRMLQARGLPGVRVLLGVLTLTEQHPPEALQYACRKAISLELWRLRELRDLARNAPSLEQPELPLQQEHRVIRPLSAYAAFTSQLRNKQ